MYSGRWTIGLEGQEKKDFEDYLANSQKILDKLHKICYNMYIESENSTNNYDNPNWPYKTADSVGYRRALKNIMTLLQSKEEGE